MQIKLRRATTILQERWVEGARSHATPLRKVAAVAVIENPYAGRDVEDLRPLIEASPELGRMLAARQSDRHPDELPPRHRGTVAL